MAPPNSAITSASSPANQSVRRQRTGSRGVLTNERKAGIRRCSGIGSRTVTYFSYNAFLREYIAAMMMHKKFHLIAAGILCFPWIAAALLLLAALFIRLL